MIKADDGAKIKKIRLTEGGIRRILSTLKSIYRLSGSNIS